MARRGFVPHIGPSVRGPRRRPIIFGIGTGYFANTSPRGIMAPKQLKGRIMNNLESLGVFQDSDGTIKHVFNRDKKITEITFLSNKASRDVVCVPTFHYCNLGCKICHLTNKGLNKNMMPVKAEDLAEGIRRSVVGFDGRRRSEKENLLISYMGVGEPLLNIKLLGDIFQMRDYLRGSLKYKNIGYAVSTIMPEADSVDKLLDAAGPYGIPIKLHFSVHSPFDAERFDLLPKTKVGVAEGLEALEKYRRFAKGNPRIMENIGRIHSSANVDPVVVHYTLIKNRNDSPAHLAELTRLLAVHKTPIMFIRFNPINGMEASENEAAWISELNRAGIKAKAYSPPGREIGSSCGEFTKHYYHEEIETAEQRREFQAWKQKHEIFR
ncbi:MAG: hypothetical protein LBL46_01960 [Rickettsiales bacterium]|jgi:adenine C2-methylase RlmN of 23S rRNA A2503 and tRNA A37|nr:hypothetical protein [Rickettsiales bacterium]